MIYRYCSISSFDTSLQNPISINIPPVRISAELYIPDNDLLCQDPSIPTNANLGNWFNWGKKSGGDGKLLYADKIVLAKRGKCMFEDKAVIAKKHGAAGLIIQNYEVIYNVLLE